VDYLTLLDLGFTFLNTFLGSLRNKLPAEVATSLQTAIDAILKHKNDVISKGALEAQRG
jgi:hypothetical protein